MGGPSVQSVPGSQSSFPTQPAQLQGLGTAITGQGTAVAPQISAGGPPYNYQLTAGLSPNQSAGIGIGNALAQQSVAGVPLANAQLLQAAGGANLPATNPYIQQILASMNQQENQQISQIENQWGGAGQGISTGLANALGQQNAAYGGAVGNLELNAYNQQAALQQQAVQQILNQAQQGYQNVMAGGQVEQNTQQAAYQAAYQQWLQQQGQGTQVLSELMPLVEEAFGQQPVDNIVSPSFGSQLLSAGATLGGALLSNPNFL